MQKLKWRVLCHSLDGNQILKPNNNPKRSGKYLCTCLLRFNGIEHRYLQIMEFNAEYEHWHDVGRESAISDVILAWTDVDMYMGDDFDYEHGVVYEKGLL